MNDSKVSITGLEWLKQNKRFLGEIYHLTFLSEEKLIDFVTPLASPNKLDRVQQMRGCFTRNECRNAVQKLVPTFRGTYKTGQRRKADGRLRAQLSIRIIPMQYQAKTGSDTQTRFTLVAFLYEHLSGLTFCCSMQEHYDNSLNLLQLTPKTWLAAFIKKVAVTLGSFPLKYQVGFPWHKLRVPRQSDDDEKLAARFTITSACTGAEEDKVPYSASFTVSLEELSNALLQQDEEIDFTKHDADYGWRNPRVRKSKAIEVSDFDSYPQLETFIDCPLPPSYYSKDEKGTITAQPITTTELKKYLGKWMADQNQKALSWLMLQEKFETRKLWLEIVLKNHNWKSEEIKDRARKKQSGSFSYNGHISDEFLPFD